MSLSRQQRTAFDSPCFEAEECSNPRFALRLRAPMDFVTVILTVNVGLE